MINIHSILFSEEIFNRLKDIKDMYNEQNEDKDKIHVSNLVRIALTETYVNKSISTISNILFNYSCSFSEKYNGTDVMYSIRTYTPEINKRFEDIQSTCVVWSNNKQRTTPNKSVLTRIAVMEQFYNKSDRECIELIDKYKGEL